MALSILQVPTSGLPEPSAKDNPTSLLDQEENQEMITQLPFVGGPRPTMTKLKVNYYFSLSISHHALPLCSLKTFVLTHTYTE